MRSDVQAIRTMLAAAVDGLDVESADERPAPDRWSIGEIVEHLARTYMGTAKGLDLCLADGRSRATPLSWRARGRQFIVITLGRYPRGVEAPAAVVPKRWGFSLALERAHGGLNAFASAAEAASERFGPATPLLDHPLLGALSVRDWCRFHDLHTRHHMRQIDERRRNDRRASRR